jgi:transcription initiation factor TFIIIB Brf1 subunit/transcription initiation factor TFIIB
MGAEPTTDHGPETRSHVLEIVSQLPLEETNDVRRAAIDICEAVDQRSLLDTRPSNVVAAAAVYMAVYRLQSQVGHIPKAEVAAAADCRVSGVESAWRVIGNAWSDLRGVDRWE